VLANETEGALQIGGNTMFHFIAGQAVGLAIGFVAGAFTPSIGRMIKGFFVAEAKVVGSKIEGPFKKV
jgi:hypothetical protein